MLRIGEVADRVGVSLRTLRFYEEAELLVPAARTEGGFRLYTEDQVQRLELIVQMKPLGFTIDEKRRLLGAIDTLESGDSKARRQANDTIREFTNRTTASIADLEVQLASAGSFHELLRKLQVG